MNKKAFVIGLDCLTPQLAFGEYLNELPAIKSLLKSSLWGKMRSTMPPITCPAWASMVTGKDPGQLGIYGFRNRYDYSYDELPLATSNYVKEKSIWDIVGEYGKKSVILGVPPSYPPKKINGSMVGCFLTPDTSSDYTYPKELKDDIRKNVGEFIIDVQNFRTSDKERLLKEIYNLSANKFKVAEYLMENKEWDLFMLVDMGPDRIHHGFWRFIDPTHNKFEKKNKFLNSVRDYYKFLDERIKDVIKALDDETTLYVVSDHGAKKIDGCLCINEWLIKNRYLALKDYPKRITKISPDMIDWKKTKAWGEGGYYGRVFFNVKGREPEGTVERKDYDKFAKEMIAKLGKIKYKPYNAKNATNTTVFRPDELYREINGVAPDLFVFFGDLYWRSAGSVGFNDIYTFDNDTGPDDANHDYHGIFIMHDKRIKISARREISIYDFAPTLLRNMGIEAPTDMKGQDALGAFQ